MHRYARPVVVFAASAVMSFGMLQLAEANRPVPTVVPTHHGGYALGELRLLRATLDRVRTQYVEPGRIDPPRMHRAALDAVERLVPEVLFRQDGERLAVRLGDWRGNLIVPPVRSLDDVERELERVADLIVRHMPADEIPALQDGHEPFVPIEYAMTNGVLQTLDPHSMLLPPEESREMDADNRGEFGGLGMTLRMLDGLLTITDIMPGTPASGGGLVPGDIIRRIDGEPTMNLSIDEAVELLRGHVGEPVALEIVRAGTPTHTARVVRESIRPNAVQGRELGGGMGYVRLRAFHINVAVELEEALDTLASRNSLDGLVLDLRDNPGGYLDKAIDVADRFLRDGEIVSTRGPLAASSSKRFARPDGKEGDFPVVVLVNANSASASEVVAGALRNNERAVVVGERTFGKGSVQNLLSLSHDSKLKITIAQYLTPGERSIQSVGIPADIELRPVVAGIADESTQLEAMLYGRERVRREADLDAHLIGRGVRQERPLFSLPYLRDWSEPEGDYALPDPRQDPELGFALDLLRTAPSSHRPEILAASGELVRRHREAAEADIVDVLAELGVDWQGGEPTEVVTGVEEDVDATLAVRTNFAKGLQAGADDVLSVTVTNRGDEPLHRIAVVVGEHELFGGVEFLMGLVPPGGTVTATQPVEIWAGYPSEIAPVELSVRRDGEEIGTVPVRVAVDGASLPAFEWRWLVEPPEDGSIDVGDRVRIAVDVRNTGRGPTSDASVRIRNRSGTALDIHTGTLKLGTPRDDRGRRCRETRPDCVPVLMPGERWSGILEVELLESLTTGYALELSIDDADAYDHGTIVRGGFYDYSELEDQVHIALGDPGAVGAMRKPPEVRLDKVPELVVTDGLITVAGRAEDDEGIEHVLVFVDDEKIFFQGGDASITSMPFTATAQLTPGLHTVSILVRDVDGYGATASRVVLYEGRGIEVMAENVTP